MHMFVSLGIHECYLYLEEENGSSAVPFLHCFVDVLFLHFLSCLSLGGQSWLSGIIYEDFTSRLYVKDQN